MTYTSVAELKKLKQEVCEQRARADYWESIAESFFTGNVPTNASLQHIIIAQWGRKRLESLKKTPVLLQAVSE